MRRSIAIASVLLFPIMAAAQEATPPAVAVTPPPPTLVIPMPREPETGVNGFRILAISAGAVVGVVAANFISGGMITPMLMGAGVGMPVDAAAAVAAAPAAAAGVAGPAVAATSAAMVAAHAGIIIVGGAVGGAVGNWLYGK
jgi:hypothetical protein